MDKKKKKERLLNEREESVLRAIVYDYILTGKPIGSRSFVQKYSFSVSPATMRNIMSDLEDMGYLKQPHTSAGRIPTDRGYRFYVDTLLDSYDLKLSEEELVREEQIKREMQLDKVFASITKMLSSQSNYAGMILTPIPDFTVVKRIDLIPLDTNQILVVLVTRTGIIIDKKVVISRSVTQDELYGFSKYLSGELCGYSLNEIKIEIFEKLRVPKILEENKAIALDIAELALGSNKEPELIIDGIENLLRIPEMVEQPRLNSLLNIIEEKNILREIIELSLQKNGVFTLIGEEISNPKISGCSLVTTSYKISNRNVGVIGIIGPTRMDYEKVVPLVDYTGKLVSDFLTKMSK